MREKAFIVRGNISENKTEIFCKKGKTYYIEVTPKDQILEDVLSTSTQNRETSDANGWSNQWMFDVAPNMGLANKMANEPSLKLCGEIDNMMFPIGLDCSFCSPQDGQLILFINHNAWLSVKGSIDVVIKCETELDIMKCEKASENSNIEEIVNVNKSSCSFEKQDIQEEMSVTIAPIKQKAKNCTEPVIEHAMNELPPIKIDTREPTFDCSFHISKYTLKESLIHTHIKHRKGAKKIKKIKWVSNDKLKIRQNELRDRQRLLFEFERDLVVKSKKLTKLLENSYMR